MHWPVAGQLAGLTNNNTFAGTNGFADGGWNRPRLTNVVALSGVVSAVTNGTFQTPILNSPIMTNGANYGNAFISPGTGTGSTQLGQSADAAGIQSVSIGVSSRADDSYDIAVGTLANAAGGGAIAIGNESVAGSTNSTAIGSFGSASAPNSISLGAFVDVAPTHENSIGIGADTTETNQVMIGASTHKVRIPGVLQVTGSITNAILTGTNRLQGAWALNERAEVTMPVGQNRITNGITDNLIVLSSPGTPGSTNVAFSGGWPGREVRYIKHNGGFPMGIANESGLAAAAERVLTGTGADVVITNSPGFFRLLYDGGASRWILLDHSD
jgi:hypothetical protein